MSTAIDEAVEATSEAIDALEQRYPPAIARHLRKLQERQKAAMGLIQAAEVSHALAEKHGCMSVEVSDVGKSKIRINVSADTFDEVLPLLRDFAINGWHTNKDDPYWDCHESNLRAYNLFDQAGTEIEVWVRLTGSGCKRVKVGEEVKPVYEFRCE